VSDRSIQPVPGPLSAVVEAPPSKSATHRALVAAALATGSSTIERPLEADDTRITLQALADLGFEVAATPSGWEVAGLGGTVPGGGEIALGESGTSFRFVTAVASLGQRPSRLDGAPRLRERPVHDLASVLERLGATLKLTGGGGGLPLEAGGSPVRGGVVSVSASHSSQFASALLLIGPRLDGGLELNLAPGAVSLPYIELTARVMREFGVEVERPDSLSWRVPAGDYAGRRYEIEGDHSSASYFLAAAAIVGGTVRPDVVPTLAVLALFADGPCSMRGIAHLRIKESDRLGVLASNLRRLGRGAEATEDALLVAAPGGPLHGATIETASDHRMAMAFAVAGLRIEGVVIDNPACVSKSNAGFWEGFSRIRTGS
jgi:3-phosphoshikimate 1-carboxyvinyltransferase